MQQKGIWKVIGASSLGTLIEWYDFYIFGSLATVLAGQFFPKTNPTAALLSTLATFAAGFLVRPFGAIVFGRLGDIIGRKHTFLLTLIIMGGATFAIGLIPSFESIGFLAPLLVLLLRLLQGLALGGEYGGAATYVAEHAPDHQRGFYTPGFKPPLPSDSLFLWALFSSPVTPSMPTKLAPSLNSTNGAGASPSSSPSSLSSSPFTSVLK
jgi:MFS family permease